MSIDWNIFMQMIINTLTMTVMFSSLFYLLKEFIFISKDPAKVWDIHSRVNSLVHGVIQIILSFIFLLNYKSDLEFQNQKFVMKIVCVSTGYFVYDLALAIIYKKNDFNLTIHHITGFAGLFLSGMMANGEFYTMLGLFIAEITNPFMNIKYFLKFYNLRHTKLYELIDISYLISYIFFRGIIGTIGFTSMLFDKKSSLFIACLYGAIWLQSAGFILKMKNMLKYKQKQLTIRKKEKIEYFWLSVNPEISKLSYLSKKEETIW